MQPDPTAPADGAPDAAEVHRRSVALIQGMDSGDLDAVGTLLGELGGPEEFAAQVVSLASLARLLLDQREDTAPGFDEARAAVLHELAGVLAAAEIR
ncbi:hypothetical protein [Actinomycetospora sp. NBRC 106375]|uniref:hypothetical protein n=1 Tax=Actinomycetospora sp. NBRC 106375 TaxID=3032207 RepID=UPI002556901A|nr:hypothetical protein [Actinomycetospora sp. NBRC 106375]